MIDTEYSCVVVHSGLRQKDRSGNIQKFKDGGARFLICTDVAARGIDISGLPFVISTIYNNIY
jgi:ATP-dependent RNA helicase DDX1